MKIKRRLQDLCLLIGLMALLTDIQSGTAKRLYDSPYHGDYAMCGNL